MMPQYVSKRHKKLRCGYTTGSCAAGAAKAAAAMLLSGKPVFEVSIKTPKFGALKLSIAEITMENDRVSCAVKKDSGDDPDVTNGIFVHAAVKKAGHGEIRVEGGTGVGRATKPGLACKPGEAAINPVPMKMIVEEVQSVCEAYGYHGGMDIVIFVPEGEAIAKKTFNPRLGITGGISILGTTGIVEPMSEAAVIDTIKLEMNQKIKTGEKHLLVCPGNYGEDFIRNELGIYKPVLMCSNYIGEMLDFSAELGFESVLLIGHAGKLVKLAAGIMNTHSRYADCRMELLALYAALNGGENLLARRVMECATTDEAVGILMEAGLCEKVFGCIMDKADYYMRNRVYDELRTGILIFSNKWGILGKTRNADDLIKFHSV